MNAITATREQHMLRDRLELLAHQMPAIFIGTLLVASLIAYANEGATFVRVGTDIFGKRD